MYNVMVKKNDRLYLRIREDVKTDLETTAELHGLSVSGLVNFLIVRAIREEKEKAPEAFQVKSADKPELPKMTRDEAIEKLQKAYPVMEYKLPLGAPIDASTRPAEHEPLREVPKNEQGKKKKNNDKGNNE